jgi:hypothetical protein
VRDWVNRGGRYVGWLDGAVLASGVGVSSATFESAEANGISSPGALFRTQIDRRSRLGDDNGRFVWAFWDSRYVMRDNGAPVAVRFPAAGTEDFFVSGYADGEEALGGTPAVLDERVGRGRTVSFAFEPNFRAFTDGTQELLRDAIFGRGRGHHHGHRPHGARAAARGSVRRLEVGHSPVRLVVATRGATAAKALLDRFGLRYRSARSAKRVAFAIAHGGGAAADEAKPWTRELARALQRERVPVVMYRVP